MHYDQKDFHRWYHSSQRVHSGADRERLVRMVIALGDYMLQRPVRSMLDLGAGEGSWMPVARRVRPRLRYLGVEPSEYAVARFGRRRNLVRGSIGDLPREATARGWDTVVCCGVLNYLSTAELRLALARAAELATGIAFLELFTAGDDVTGDLRGRRAPATTYRRLLRGAGFRRCGPHCYVGPRFEGVVAQLETDP